LPAPPFAEDARVLFISRPSDAALRSLAQQLTKGLIVVLGSLESTQEDRKLHADLDNVMFVPATAEDIPWQNSFFDEILDPQATWTSSPQALAECHRVSRKRE